MATALMSQENVCLEPVQLFQKKMSTWYHGNCTHASGKCWQGTMVTAFMSQEKVYLVLWQLHVCLRKIFA